MSYRYRIRNYSIFQKYNEIQYIKKKGLKNYDIVAFFILIQDTLPLFQTLMAYV